MAGMRWQDRVSNEEVAKKYGLKETEKVPVVWTCKKEDRGGSAEDGGEYGN